MKKVIVATSAIMACTVMTTSAVAGDYVDNYDNHKRDVFGEHFPDTAQYITPILDIRYRYEFIDQDKKKDARASTLRSRVDFETKKYEGFSLLVEGEHVEVIGNDLYYSTVNGKSKYARLH